MTLTKFEVIADPVDGRLRITWYMASFYGRTRR